MKICGRIFVVAMMAALLAAAPAAVAAAQRFSAIRFDSPYADVGSIGSGAVVVVSSTGPDASP